MSGRILSLTARAWLDASGDTLPEARRRAAEGDIDDAWLVREYDDGRVLVCSLVVTAHGERGDGRPRNAAVSTSGIWLQCDDVPHVEAQVSETATMDFARLAHELRQHGVDVAGVGLNGMHVHVELEESLRAALGAPPATTGSVHERGLRLVTRR